MLARETTFRTTGALEIESARLTAVPLSAHLPRADDIDCVDGAVVFRAEGWYEILLAVEWDPEARRGTRFSHTSVPGQQPLHSEAVSAGVLTAISGGRQLLRGNSLFGPERTDRLALEVWQDSGEGVELKSAAITVRELEVPWHRAGPWSP